MARLDEVVTEVKLLAQTLKDVVLPRLTRLENNWSKLAWIFAGLVISSLGGLLLGRLLGG